MKQKFTLYATDAVLRKYEVEAESLEEATDYGFGVAINDWEVVDDLYEFRVIKAVNHTTGEEITL